MTSQINNYESVQEYSDRFTSLMALTVMKDCDNNLVSVYIDEIDFKIHELLNVFRASALNLWRR